MRYLGLTAAFAVSFASVLAGQPFSIGNYQLVGSPTRVTLTKSIVTYSATLTNGGGAQTSVSATATSLDTNSFTVVADHDTLNFAPVPANSQVASSNTFQILVDRTVPFDFAKVQWTFKTGASAPPIANAGPNQTVSVGATVTLNGSGSTNPSGMGTLTYSWTFKSKPAGSSATLTNPTSVMPAFVVDVLGTYVVTLTVSNGVAGVPSSSADVTISTSCVAPTANAGPNQTVALGATVTLDGSKSTDACGLQLSYAWTLIARPTGSTAVLSGANTVSPTFVADKSTKHSAEPYIAQLIVSDSNGTSTQSTVTISTQNSAPVANAGPSQAVNVGALVQLNGSGSTDVDGDPLTFKWSFNSVPPGSTAVLSSTTAVNPTFTADKPGTYLVQLIVNDGQTDSAASTVTITTNQVLPPVANAGPDQTVGLNALVTLDASASSDPNTPKLPLTYSWSFTGKPANSNATLTNPTSIHPTFVADQPGDYTVQVTVSNGFQSSSATVKITTTVSKPIANAGPNQSVTVGATVTLNGSGSSDPQNLPLTYSWSITSRPAGSAATLTGATTVAPVFVADVAGTYVVQLIVNNGFKPSDPATVTITAGVPSITATAGTPQNGCVGQVFTTALQATVKDAGGNPVSGVSVTFTAPSSGASGTFAGGATTATVTTDASGVATAPAFTGNGTPGSYTVTASAPNVATPANFALTNNTGAGCPGILTITATSGSGQSAVVNTAFAAPLVATVTDQFGNPVSGVTVTFTAPVSGNPSVTFAGGVNTAVTNAAGVATSTVLTANTIAGGPYRVSASTSNAPTPATFFLTNTPDVAASITPGGTPQSACVNTAFANSFTALVKDQFGNILTGVSVTFTVQPAANGASGSFGGSATATVGTNLAGIAAAPAFTANSTPGSYTIVASISGLAATASYSLTNTTACGGFTIAATSGTPQSAVVGTAFGAPLIATVKDSNGNPVSGVSVTFTAPSSGASGTFAGGGNTVMVTTNGSGIATSPAFTANTVAGGPYNVAASALGAAANFALTNTPGQGTLTAASGSMQTAQVNTAFAAPLVATLKDQFGNPISGVTVTFTPVAGSNGQSGSFSGGNTAVTDASGNAVSNTFTANSIVGSYTVNATAPGVANPAVFSLTNANTGVGTISATSGTPQSATVNTAFAAPLVATVKDVNGNPVGGVTVTFMAPASGASGTFAGDGVTNTAVTNASGVATSATFTANTTAGQYNVTASAPGVATPASFALTNTPGPASTITATGGTPQSTKVNMAFASPLSATVKDQFDNPVSGVTVTFTAPSSGASGSFSGGNTAVTGANGIAVSSTFTANTIAGGPYNVTASAPGVSSPATFVLTNTPDVPGSITATSGGGQMATVNTPFAAPLVATVKDQFGNPVSGVTVTFTPPASGASGSFSGGNTAVTDANGVATSSTFTANTTAGGPYNVSASAPGVSSPATFALTNKPAAAATIMATSGSGQSAVTGTQFTAPLVATVKDQFGNPVSGVTVTFTAPGSGASGTFAGDGSTSTAVTDAGGVATSTAFTANGTAGGPYNVTASAPGVGTPANFALTNTPPVPATITAASGTPQSTPINTAFASLIALVKDANGNPVSGVTVTFTAPSSGPSGTFPGGVTTATATTNGSGLATAPTFTANNVASPANTSYNVTASVATAGVTPANFVLTNTAGTAALISAVSGTPQSTKVGTAFGAPLVAIVKDSGGNPVSGVTVTFAIQPAANGASGAFAGGVNTAVTDASGQATSAAITANSTAGTFMVNATAPGVGAPAVFTLTSTPDVAASITVVSGTPQSAVITTAFAQPLKVVVKDQFGNPVSGVTVTYIAPGSGPSGTFANGVNSAITDASGIATSGVFTANTIASPAGTSYTVSASVAGVAGSASFSLVNLAGPAAAITATGGTPQNAQVNAAFASPLVATVTDANGNPIPNVTVTFTVTPAANGASGSFAGGTNTAVTNAAGVATSQTFTANGTAGSYTVTGTVQGLASSATYNLTNTPPPLVLAIAGGNNQTAEINHPFGDLIVQVQDTQGNPAPGVTVTFTPQPVNGASGSFVNGVNTAVTDANGIAHSATLMANGTPGTYTVQAAVSGTPVSFSLTNEALHTGQAISVGSVSLGKNLQTAVLVTLPTPAPQGGTRVVITSGDNSKLLVAARSGDIGTGSVGSDCSSSATCLVIPAASTQTLVFLQGLGSTGAVPLYASSPGFTTGVGTITETPSGFVLDGGNGNGASISVNQGVATTFTVKASRLNPDLTFAEVQALRAGVSANVPVTSSDTNVGTISTSPVPFNPLDTTNTTQFTGVSQGTTTVTAGTPSGFSTPSGANSVPVTVTANGINTPPTVTVGQNLETIVSGGITLTGAAGNPGCMGLSGVCVTISSDDSSKLLLSTAPDVAGMQSITLRIPPGLSHTQDFYVQGLTNSGSVTYTVTVPGFGNPVKGTVNLTPGGIVIAGPFGVNGIGTFTTFQTSAGNATTITVYSARLDSGGNYQELQMVRGGFAANVTVTSSNTAVGNINGAANAQVVIPGGGFSNTVQFNAVGAGSATIAITQPVSGFNTPVTADTSLTATVIQPKITVTDQLRIGKNLQETGTIQLSAAAPAAGLDVVLTATGPNASLLKFSNSANTAGMSPQTVHVAGGATTASFFLQVFGNSGEVTYTGAASGYQTGTGAIALAPSVVTITGLFGSTVNTTGSSGPTTLTLNTFQLDPAGNLGAFEDLAGGTSVSVALTNDNTNAGTVATPVTFTGGTNSATTQFTPKPVATTQTAHIAVVQPFGSTPSSFTMVTITVTP